MKTHAKHTCTILATTLVLALSAATSFAAPLQWTCDWPEAKSQTFSLYQGETATFEPTFRVNGRAVTNATIEAVWYQASGMGQAWWRLDNATFAPSNDVGAASYRFFVEAKASGGTIYRANGALRMLPSPGFIPNKLPLPANVVTQSHYLVTREYSHDVTLTNAQLQAGQIVAGLTIVDTNLVFVVPVIGTTPCVRVWAPYAEGYYTPNQFSAIEIGNQNQALFSQRIIAGTALYCPTPSMLRFTSGLDPDNPQSTCTTLQDYLDVLSPETIAARMAGFVPTNGDSVIDGSLTVNGLLVANGAMVFTNANVTINGSLTVGGRLLADGIAISNGMCNAQFVNTSRIHIGSGTGDDPYGHSLTNITFGGTWNAPYSDLRAFVANYLSGALLNMRSDITSEIYSIVDEELAEWLGEDYDIRSMVSEPEELMRGDLEATVQDESEESAQNGPEEPESETGDNETEDVR